MPCQSFTSIPHLWPLPSGQSLSLLIPIFFSSSLFSYLLSLLSTTWTPLPFLPALLQSDLYFFCSVLWLFSSASSPLPSARRPLTLSSDHPFFIPNINSHFKPPHIFLPAIRPLWSFLPAFVHPPPSSSYLPPSLAGSWPPSSLWSSLQSWGHLFLQENQVHPSPRRQPGCVYLCTCANLSLRLC